MRWKLVWAVSKSTRSFSENGYTVEPQHCHCPTSVYQPQMLGPKVGVIMRFHYTEYSNCTKTSVQVSLQIFLHKPSPFICYFANVIQEPHVFAVIVPSNKYLHKYTVMSAIWTNSCCVLKNRVWQTKKHFCPLGCSSVLQNLHHSVVGKWGYVVC